MKRHALLLCALALPAIGCTSFAVATPNHFVALPEPGAYDWRATTPDGMVLGVRVLDNDAHGDLAFWSQALELRLRAMGGYALLDKKDMDADGVKGVLLRFGHDEAAQPHLYDVALFVTAKRLFLLEAGGARDTFARYTADVDTWLRSFRPD